MIASFILALREGLEAALIIGLVLGTLRKIQRQELNYVVWLGLVTAVIVSFVSGTTLYLVGISFEGTGEQIFEGLTMLFAAALLTWMIFWMYQYARHFNILLEANVRQAASQTSQRALFLVAFFAVVREGVELALFLTAATFASEPHITLLGAGLGLVTAVALAWALFSSLLKLNLQRFFQITGFLLILFAAGLVAHGVHELNEAHWIPEIVEHVWNLNPILNESTGLGSLLGMLFGYNGDPSLTEVLAYVLYFVLVAIGLRQQQKPALPSSAVATAK